MNGNSLFSNILDPFNGRGNNSFSFGLDPSNPIDIFGTRSDNTKARNISPSTSPHTSSSRSSSASVDLCSHCGHNAGELIGLFSSLKFIKTFFLFSVQRCLDCNDVFCPDCVNEHSLNPFTQQHALVGLSSPPQPIGSMNLNLADRHAIMQSVANRRSLNEPQCESHGETLRFLCETCKKIVCQECTLKDHRY